MSLATKVRFWKKPFRLTLTLLGPLLLAQGCNSNGRPALESEHRAGLRTNNSFESSNVIRNYHLYKPENPDDASIVLLLHGQSGSADQILGLNGVVSPFKLWLDVARQENLILVVPDGLRGSNEKQGWNDCRSELDVSPDSDDVRFLTDLIEHIKVQHTSLGASVFAVGISNGGFMTQRLADETPETIDAMSIIVSSRPVNSECLESNVPVPALFMNGTSDSLVPYYGGQIISNRGEVLSTPDTINYWINRNQSETTPSITELEDVNTRDESTGTRYSYRNSQGKIVVELYEITNGGHTEPSITERYGPIYSAIVGNQNGDIEMAYEVWDFLKQF